MFYTIKQLLEEHNVPISETVYRNCSEEVLNFKIASGNFYDISQETNGFLRFKNTVNVYDFDMLKNELPLLEQLWFPHKNTYAYYSDNLPMIKKALEEEPENLAVEGGPCLFGENEVTVNVLIGNEEYSFDYASGKRYLVNGGDQEDEDLAAFIHHHLNEIKDIIFENRKTGLTYQEYQNIQFPMSVASTLKIPLVISLPDMSYRKYLYNCAEVLNDSLKKKVISDFNEIIYTIADYYLDLIAQLEKRLSIPKLTVVHSRREDLIAIYEEKRKPFIERNKILKSLSSNTAKFESIKDYISLPAMPYYIYGSTKILELTSMDETDSYRKCRFAHKSVLKYACILTPELLSDDGVNTLYCTSMKHKKYGDYKEDLL